MEMVASERAWRWSLGSGLGTSLSRGEQERGLTREKLDELVIEGDYVGSCDAVLPREDLGQAISQGLWSPVFKLLRPGDGKAPESLHFSGQEARGSTEIPVLGDRSGQREPPWPKASHTRWEWTDGSRWGEGGRRQLVFLRNHRLLSEASSTIRLAHSRPSLSVKWVNVP